jgi:hypothetical protein
VSDQYYLQAQKRPPGIWHAVQVKHKPCQRRLSLFSLMDEPLPIL